MIYDAHTARRQLSMLEKHYAALVGSASEEAAEKIEKAFTQRQ
jgi:hypothetical protein